MNYRTALCDELAATWHREIPLAAAMQIGVDAYDGHTLTVRAPLPANRNLHGTAFAGALYSTCVLTGWGLTWLGLREHGHMGLIVVADSRIQFRKAVTSDVVCRCAADAAALSKAVEAFAASGRMQLDLECTIDNDGRRAVQFTGTYVVRAGHS